LIKEIKYKILKNGCYECTSHVPGGNGYPCKKVDGVYTKISRIVLKNKLGRPIKPGFWALHSCDNPLCINPSHIREGTRWDNEKDKKERNRMPSKENHHGSKLRSVDVDLIRKMHELGYGSNRIATFFKMSQTNISQIIRGKTWTK
jgi:hypothetical protein